MMDNGRKELWGERMLSRRASTSLRRKRNDPHPSSIDDEEVGGGSLNTHANSSDEECKSRKGRLAPVSTKADFANNTYETKAVHVLKMILLLLLCTLAVLVAVVVFVISRSSEMKVFREVSGEFSSKILDSVGHTMDLTLGAIDGLATSIASHAQSAGEEWPFVTLPGHSIHFAKVRAMAKAMYLCFIPLVTLDNRAQWENEYSVPHGERWVNESFQTQKEDINYHGIHLSEYEPSRVIYRVDKPAEGPGPFLVSWQAYPIVPKWAPYNWDYGTYTIFDKVEVMQNLRVSISKVLNMPDSDDPWVVSEADIATNWAKDFVSPEKDPKEPWFHIFYPIAADAGSTLLHPGDVITNKTKNDLSEPRAVGAITMIIYVRDLIRDVLPSDSEGVHVVFENTCNQTFTYQIDGPSALFLGRGDHHDPAFDSLEQKSTFVSLDKTISHGSPVYSG
jgi:hypothetical protein